MKTKLLQSCRRFAGFALLLAATGLAGTFTTSAASPPLVTNVVAVQQANSTLVNISYQLSDPDSTVVTVNILVSKDSGATWNVPASTFTGDYGTNVSVTATPVTKAVVWNAGADWNGHFTANCRVRVIANDADLRFIPGGSFTMGNAIGDSDITDAPTHTVTVSPVFMDSTLVTGGKWGIVIDGYATAHGYSFDNAGAFRTANDPVQTINWFDAVKWCNARSQFEGVTPVYYTDAAFTIVYKSGQATPYVKTGANGYRLPTEAEWEKAARGGLSGHRFPWSNTENIDEGKANYTSLPTDGNLQLNAPVSCPTTITYDTRQLTYRINPGNSGYNTYQCEGKSNNGTTPVGQFGANTYGLFDMAGNANEWCWDWYNNSFYSSGQVDPQGPANPQSNRVTRGGSWSNTADHLRCANRASSLPSATPNDLGFRCVRGF